MDGIKIANTKTVELDLNADPAAMQLDDLATQMSMLLLSAMFGRTIPDVYLDRLTERLLQAVNAGEITREKLNADFKETVAGYKNLQFDIVQNEEPDMLDSAVYHATNDEEDHTPPSYTPYERRELTAQDRDKIHPKILEYIDNPEYVNWYNQPDFSKIPSNQKFDENFNLGTWAPWAELEKWNMGIGFCQFGPDDLIEYTEEYENGNDEYPITVEEAGDKIQSCDCSEIYDDEREDWGIKPGEKISENEVSIDDEWINPDYEVWPEHFKIVHVGGIDMSGCPAFGCYDVFLVVDTDTNDIVWFTTHHD